MNRHTIFDTRRTQSDDAMETLPTTSTISKVSPADEALASPAFRADRGENAVGLMKSI
jgi:hypothetical protein